MRGGAKDTGGVQLLQSLACCRAHHGYDRDTQIYFGGTGANVESNIHQITGSAVVKLPCFARLSRMR